MRTAHVAWTIALLASTSFGGVVYVADFESPSYSLGNLTGQQNWDQFDGDAPPADLFVQNAVVRSVTGGAQAVRFRTNGASSDPTRDFTDAWSGDSGVSAAQLLFQPLVRIQFDMMRGALGSGEVETAAWGLDIYDSTASAAVATIVTYDDNVGPGVAGTNAAGELVFLGDGSPRGTWDTYTIDMNYLTRTYDLSLNGTPIGATLTFNALADNGIGDVDFLALSRGTDSAYFDNLIITTSALPEPATLSALPLAAFFLRRRR